jgi:hypothetical protein
MRAEMKESSNLRLKFSSLLIYTLCIALLLFVTACGDADKPSSGTGSITFNVEWIGAPTLDDASDSNVTKALDCVAAGVSSVEAIVYNSSGNSIATGGPWVCTVGSGTIYDVDAGSNYTVSIIGRNIPDEIVYWGDKTGITVTANQSNDAGEIPVSQAKPTGCEATAGDGQVTIDWDDVPGATSYNIYWSTTAGVTKDTGTKIANVTRPYIHTGLTNGQAYYYIVTAVFSSGESIASEEDNDRYNVPLVITGAATDVTTVSATLNATVNPNGSSADYYFKYGTDTSYGMLTGIKNAGAGTEDVPVSAEISGLSLGTTYHFQIVATNNYGTNFGNDQELTTLSGDPPDAPTGISASAGDGQVTIGWDDVSGATSYNIYWSTTEDVTKDTGTKIADATSPYTHTGLTNGTTYYYVVTAENSYGESAESTEVPATPSATCIPPSAPAGIDAIAGDGQVSLSWNTVEGAISYNIYWSTTSGVTKTTGTQIADATSPYTHTGLTNDTTYYYVVTAVGCDESVESIEDSATPSTTGTPPPPPTVISASPGDQQVTISWDAVGGATSYNIYWSTTSGVTKITGTQIADATSPYTHTGLTNGTTYYYVVTALNLYGEGDESTEVSATPEGLPPEPPTNISVIAEEGQITIGWDDVSGATSYNIYWLTTSGVTKITGTQIADATSPYMHTGLTNGTTYYYVVTAANANGESSESVEMAAVPMGIPTGVVATPGDGYVIIQWDAAPGATSYNIYWLTTSGVTKSTGTKIANATSPHTHTGLTNDTTYYYVVTAANNYGESSESVEVSATPEESFQPPIAPTISASPGDGQVTISWDSVLNATSYNVYMGLSDTVSSTNYSDVNEGVIALSYTWSSLTNNTTYYFVVTAVNDYGESSDSNVDDATPEAPPNPPTGVTATSGDEQVTIDWNPVVGATSYTIYWATWTPVAKDSYSGIIEDIATDSHIHADLTNGTTYYYVVTANKVGQSDISSEVNATPAGAPIVTTDVATSVTSNTARLNGTVNPNALSTSYYFEYGETTAYGFTTTAADAGGGTSAEPVYADISGLSPDTEYHFRVVATNSVGTTYGDDATFRTIDAPGAAPGTVMDATSESATLIGTVDPNGDSTTYYFEYGETTAYGYTTTPTDAGSGWDAGDVSAAITGLTPDTQYHFRIVATNSVGTDQSDDATFRTIGAPVAVTGAATDVTSTTATLNGTVDPNGDSTTYYFEYGETTAYGYTTTPTDAGSGWDAGDVSAAITGLTPDTQYHFRIVATNSVGTDQSDDATFTTTDAPVAVTSTATDVTSSTATLNGTVDPNGDSTTYYFEYGLDTNYGSTTTSSSAGAGWDAGDVSTGITGLSANTTYHFRIVATNSFGSDIGDDVSFTTPDLPGANTGSATSVTSSSATLNGLVNPNGISTNYYFEYGETTAYGSTTTGGTAGSGVVDVPVSDDITGLSPDTDYHFRVVATNTNGTNYGADESFRTITLPVAVTGAATDVTNISATLNGTVDPNGDSTTYYFEYGTTTAYGNTTTPADAGSGWDAISVSASISGLSLGTEYHFRIVATNSAGSDPGDDATFTTTSILIWDVGNWDEAEWGD